MSVATCSLCDANEYTPANGIPVDIAGLSVRPAQRGCSDAGVVFMSRRD